MRHHADYSGATFDETYSEIFHEGLECIRSNHRRCSVRKSVLIDFAKFTGKHLCNSFFFNKVSGLRPGT